MQYRLIHNNEALGPIHKRKFGVQALVTFPALDYRVALTFRNAAEACERLEALGAIREGMPERILDTITNTPLPVSGDEAPTWEVLAALGWPAEDMPATP